MAWIKVWNRRHTLQHDFLGRFFWFLQNPYYHIKNMMIVSTEQGRADTYFQKSEWDKLMKNLAKEVFKKDFLSDVLKRFIQDRKMFKITTLRISQREILAKLSNKELLKRYEKLKKAYLRYTYFFWSPWAVNEVVAPWFEEKLRQKFGRKDSEFIFESVTVPSKHILMEKQKILLLEHKLKGDLKSYLAKHVANYQWLKIYSLSDKPYTAKDFLKQIKGIEPNSYIKKDRERQKQDSKNFYLALSQLKNYSNLRRIAELLHEYAWLRTERVDAWREVIFSTKPFYRELEKRMELKAGQGPHLAYEEINNFLKFNILPDKKQIKGGELLYLRNGKYNVIRDKEKIKQILKREIKGNIHNIDSLTGKIANRGLVKGRVRIVMNPEDCQRIKKGDILVSNMTHPDYIFGIKKAVAIVTDEGGVSCHAAIVSRELGIPCVIGTKIATKVLKDGDLVEVDAEKGVVRKIHSVK